jgi:RNA polymerase sigma factor (sigma-70 family)
MEPSDEALVVACRNGDPHAWEILTKRYRRLIYTIARRTGLSEEQSDEVCQYVFAALVEHLDNIVQPALIRKWLATTAKRHAISLSQRDRAKAVSIGEVIEYVATIPDDALLPDQVLLRLEEQHLIRTAVGMLDQRCGLLMEQLFYRSNPPSYAEIARMLNLPEGSIGPLRTRCLQKLRRLLYQSRF